MNPERILAKAEAWKQRSHRLSLGLRLKSVNEAATFLREHGVVLWNAKAEPPNLLDAIIGRIANGQERVYGKPAENCYRWREQIIRNPEFLDCRFFGKLSTVLHQDLWPYATVFARLNRKRIEEHSGSSSKDMRKIIGFLRREGPTRSDILRRALRYSTPEQGRAFHKAKRELQNQLVLLGTHDESSESHTHAEILDFWENRMPKAVRGKADQIDKNTAREKLLGMTLQSSVVSSEKRIPSWFNWCDSLEETVEKLVGSKKFIRVSHKRDTWIVPRTILESTK